MPPRRKKPPVIPPTRLTLRPSDVKPVDMDRLLNMIKMGTPPRDACHALRIPPARYAEWMDEKSTDPEFVKFREDVLQADGAGVATQHLTLWQAGMKRKDEKTGDVVFDDRPLLVRSHERLLERRRPVFQGQGTRGSPSEPGGPEMPSPPAPEIEVAEQIIQVCLDEGVVIPQEIQDLLLKKG